MKSRKNWWIGLLCLCAVLLAGLIPAQGVLAEGKKAQNARATIPVARATGNVNMRSSMEVIGEENIILTIRRNNIVEVLKKESNGWYRLRYNGKTGYAKQKYFKIFTPEQRKTTARLRLRSSMNLDVTNNIILVIPKGKAVEVLRTMTDGWIQVRYNGKIGYVMGSYLTRSQDLRKTLARVNLRSSMSLASADNIIMTIPKGETVEVLAKKSDGWLRVRYKGITGYVKAVYIAPASGAQAAGAGPVVG